MKLLAYEVDKRSFLGVLNEDETWVYPVSAAGMEYRSMKDLIREAGPSEMEMLDYISKKMPGDVIGAAPVEEIKVGFDILKSLRIRARGINFIACPTCSRQEFDVIGTVNALEQRLEDIITPMDVSIIGCVVNGPGEALVSTLGVTGGNKKSGLYEDGVRKDRLDNDDMIDQLEARIRAKASMLDEARRIDVQQLEAK